MASCTITIKQSEEFKTNLRNVVKELEEKLNKKNDNKMENLWELIAEKRGLKIGEEFIYSENDDEFVNRIYKNRLEYKNTSRKEDEWCRETYDIISEFIAGEGTIEKLPPKFADSIRCKVGEEYKCVLSNGRDMIVIFMGKSEDFYRRKAGNMFAVDAVIPQEQIDKIVNEMKE